MIRFNCPACDKTLKIKPRHAGRKVACPRCNEQLTVPAETAPPQVPPRDDAMASGMAGPGDPDAAAWAAYDEERRAARRRSRTEEDELDLTPMVDVTFLLLIFFMITASFQMQRSLPTSSPQPEQEAAASAVTEDEPEEEPVVIEIAADNAVYVDGRPIPLPEVDDALAQLKAEDARVELMLEVDRGAFHGTVVAVVDAAAQAGIESVERTSVGD